jgi:hypothetical protein
LPAIKQKLIDNVFHFFKLFLTWWSIDTFDAPFVPEFVVEDIVVGSFLPEELKLYE